jgi:dihydrofolate synthase/folylpolyglutamate synthase
VNYSETIDWLFQQFPAYHLLGQQAYNPGLKNTEELAEFFGNPQQKLRFVHVGGTNGKGSTSNMLASILTETGEKVGLFTSPHLFDFTERIRINGQPIDSDFVIAFCEKVRTHKWTIQPSFFEITWMMALSYFEAKKCSIVIAEVGLGGRLDATNIITPVLAIITNIGLDHTHLLGDTKAAIAQEKAGIIKKGIPVVIGEPDSDLNQQFDSIIQQVGSSRIPLEPITDYPAGIIGYQKKNYQLVLTASTFLKQIGFQINNNSILRGIERLKQNTGFIGRLELVDTAPNVYIDCAHNAHGIAELFQSIPPSAGKLHLLYGTSSDKDLTEIAPLLPSNAHYYFTTFSNERSASTAQLQMNFSEIGEKVTFFENPLAAYQAMQHAANKNDTCVIFGSFFLIHDFFELFFQKPLAE